MNDVYLPDAVRRDTGIVHLGDAVRAGLVMNNLRAFSVAVSLSQCPFCPPGECDCDSPITGTH